MNVIYSKTNIEHQKYLIISIIFEKKVNAAISPFRRMAVKQTTLGIKHLFIEIVSKIKSLRNFPNTEPTSLQP